ncbi:MAG: hypothetical protein EVA67_01665 [OM182 bacterium]|jgi:hypothetical protein|nr:MAG: hypothetical protein EVA67_01665 [OM182 bacterium]|tara:strand:- start:16111 stop:16554 length:444 start_codon:yes stop_codon:yes gene_type:complete
MSVLAGLGNGLFRVIMLFAFAAASFALAVVIASESGEVVVLETQSEAGDNRVTRLWVVDHDASMWLRGDQNSAWYKRLAAQQRQGQPSLLTRAAKTYVVFVDYEPEHTEAINDLMAEKYGWGDRFISAIGNDRASAVVLRIVPVGAE